MSSQKSNLVINPRNPNDSIRLVWVQTKNVFEKFGRSIVVLMDVQVEACSSQVKIEVVFEEFHRTLQNVVCVFVIFAVGDWKQTALVKRKLDNSQIRPCYAHPHASQDALNVRRLITTRLSE